MYASELSEDFLLYSVRFVAVRLLVIGYFTYNILYGSEK